MTEREREAIELLDRLYNRHAPRQLDDSGMFEEWLDEEVAAFIRKWGPFAEQLRGGQAETARDEYPNAYAVPIERRMTVLAWVLEKVKASYGGEQIALRNVAALVDGVADAVVRDDRATALVRGLRLLSEAELVELWGKLGGEL